MIRAEANEPLARARTRSPVIVGEDAASVVRQLATARLEAPVASAVRTALRELESTAADIVVAPDASLYRVFPVGPEEGSTGPQPGRSDPWATREPGAAVLVVGDDALLVRLAEALAFVGYTAERAEDRGDLAGELGRLAPLVVVLGPDKDGGPPEGALAASREHGCAVVLLGDGASPEGVDARLPLPVSTARLASLLDPLLEKARERRSAARAGRNGKPVD